MTQIEIVSLKALIEQMVFDAKLTRPLSDAHGATIEGEISHPSRIAGLLCGCGPAAILWTVRAIIVDAFNAVRFGWPWSHVGVKGSEVPIPSIADEDAPPAISRISAALWILTTLSHASPNDELGGLFGPACKAMFHAGWMFALKTSTRPALAVRHVGKPNNFSLTAITSTHGRSARVGTLEWFSNNCPSAKNVANLDRDRSSWHPFNFSRMAA